MGNIKPLKIVSLFSGCGGLDLGLEGGFDYLGNHYKKNPLHIVWANDINEKATKTQQLNFPDTQVVCGDITKLLGIDDEQDKTIPLFKEELILPKADIVVGGFPCQDFSLAGKRRGLTVKRGKLYQSMAEVIKRVKPKLFLAENVKGLLSWENGLGIKTIIEDFKKLGYHVEYRLFNTADFGVPQTRERVIIVGVRDDLKLKIKWAKPTNSADDKKLKPWVTLKEAIGDIEDEEIQKKLPNFGYSKAKYFPGSQGNTKTKADKPGPTMRAEHHGNIEFHYGLDRRLSAREAARIQSFPDNFTFVSSVSDAYRQIGNAVAPVFGWHLAQMIIKTLEKGEKNDV
jgi:DNA (cytosine-5)-methyltransferase 1